MKICVMHVLSSFEVGGAETVALELGRLLDRSAFRVAACSLTGGGPMALRFRSAHIEPFAVRRSEFIPGYDPVLAWRLTALFRRERVCVVHCHNSFAKVYGTAAARLAGVPVVICTQHAVWSDGEVEDPPLMSRLVNPLVSHFVAVAEHVSELGQETGRIAPGRASVIYNGVDLSRFAPVASRQIVHDKQVVVGCVGRLSPEKRHTVLLRAMAQVTPRCPNARLHLVGDGPLRARLEQEADHLGLTERVKFLGLRNDIPDLLRSMDVFVLASSTEGLPLTVLEAMASGLPVVATNVGGVPELIKDGRNGLLVPRDDPVALAAAIERLIKDAELRARMGKAGREMAEERFDISVAARRHGELYLKLLADKGIRL